MIFDSFLYFFWRSQHAWRDRGVWLSASAAGLALFWNAGSLLVLAFADTRQTEPAALIAFSFSVLSLLPAVLLHLSLDRCFRWVWLLGYALSAVTVGLHFVELGVTVRTDSGSCIGRGREVRG